MPIKGKIEVQPTSICNNRCGYCVGAGLFPKKTASLSKEALVSVAREVSRTGIMSDIKLVVISGMLGEPLLNPHTIDFMRELKDGPSVRQHIGLYTNGTRLDKEVSTVLVSENRIGDYVNIHLSAHPWTASKEYREIHGASPWFQGLRVLNNIEALTNLKEQRNSMLFIRINFLATAHNSADLKMLERSLKRLKGLGVDAIRVSVPIETRFSPIEKGYFLNEEQVAQLEQFEDTAPEAASKVVVMSERLMKVTWGKNPYTRCFVKDNAIVISPDGFATPCCWTTYPSFPKRGGKVSEGIARLMEKMRGNKFDPREICPPCSRTDHDFNRRETSKAKSSK